MEKLIDKIYEKVNEEVNEKVNKLFYIIHIQQIKNVEINNENDKNNKNNKKLFIYKNYGIQIKYDIKFKITFFKIINELKLEKIFELENIKIKVPNQMVIMYKYNEIWNYELYDENYQNLLNYFCKKFNIKAIINK